MNLIKRILAFRHNMVEANINSSVINKQLFDKEELTTALIVPVNEIGNIQRKFHDYILQRPKFKAILPCDDDKTHKRLIFEQRLVRNPDFKAYNSEKKWKLESDYPVKLSYENFGLQEVLGTLLPKEVDNIGGFETIGEIAHLNLNERQLPFKSVIGQAILDKNPCLRTVVTKIGQIESTFRFYKLECIAGDNTTFETIQVEDKVRFAVDVSKVYWCSKLSTERTRMIDQFLKDNEVLCDMFCGVGPLSVKAAVKRPNLKVLANDLNPEGVEFLKRNIKLNKIEKRVLPFNMDARQFLRMLVDKDDKTPEKLAVPKDFLRFDHCYMNLPVDAVEFLDCFIGAFRKADKDIWLRPGENEIKLPLIHVYGFTFEQEREKALEFFIERIGKAMNFPGFTASMVLDFHNIRDVSPQSRMYSTTFRLPAEVAFAEPTIYEEFKPASEKRPKLN